jgi:two-component system, sensor histidine kinase
MDPEEAEKCRKHLLDMTIRQESFCKFEFSMQHKKGHSLIIEANGKPVFNELDQLKGYRIVASVVNSWKKVEHELIMAKEKAAQANLDKNRFLAKMSHEIRNPLNVIMDSNEMLSSNNLSFTQKEWTAMIKISAEALLNIINDVLDYSRAEDGKLCLNKLKFDLHKEVESVISLFNNQASEKGLHLSLNLKGEIPRKVVGDPGRLRQVISNLVENAIQYTRKGEVTVTLEPVRGRIEKAECGQQPECCTIVPIHFSVQDEGIGMSPDQVDILMQSTYQPDQQISSGEYKGPGLGLALSKKLVELMGGSIGITSTLGSGSTFYFTIPFTLFKDVGDSSRVPVTKKATLKEEPCQEVKSLEILLVEDKPMNQKLAATILENSGHRVTTANNGIEALELCRKRCFDLIFMDIQMPEMGGLEATALIRALDKEENRRTPIIAITAYGMPEDQNKFLQAGMDYCLTKPVSSKDLYFVIAAVTEKFPDETEKQDIVLNEIREMLQRMEGNTELLEELVEIFIPDFHKDVAVMKNALISRDAECVAFIAHGLKGDLGNLGMKSAFNTACELEIMAKENNFEKVLSLLDLLKHEVKCLEKFISQDDWQKRI